MERTRAGAATVTEGWAMGAAAASEIRELVLGMAAGGIVIHHRSSRVGLGKFCRWRFAAEKRISPLALLTNA